MLRTPLSNGPNRRLARYLVLAVLALGVGCSKDAADNRIDDPPDMISEGQGMMASEQIQPSTSTDSAYSPTPSTTIERQTDLDPLAPSATSTDMTPIPGDPSINSGVIGDQPHPYKSPLTIATADDTGTAEPSDESNQLQLPPGLAPGELIDFLSQADQFMQLLLSGRAISDRREAFEEMNRVAKIKLEASRRLVNHDDADAKDRIEGARGEMQALSHLAAQGSVEAADELAGLAQKNIESDDIQLAADSRVVLIGFAIEGLQAGKEGAADRIVSLIESVESTDAQPDVPALMMMGHARNLLAQYEFDEQMIKVRQHILKLFASASDPEIAKMAAQAAGNVRFDNVEKLRAAILDGTVVSQSDWADSMKNLINEAPDLVTVQYLAGAALEFEAASQEELAAATYEVMQESFDDSKTATGREVELAVGAREVRQRIIGNTYNPSLPTTSGASMPISDYQGKIILMPFWASGFAQSLQIIPMLKAIEKQHPDDVVIVGMNLDPAETRVDEFEPDKRLGFPSYRSESSAEQSAGNPVAAQFGMVSMPFVAILDQEQRIVALDFTGSKLKPTVEKLLNK